MITIGKTNKLQVVKQVDFGLYLDGGEHGEILLPARYVPAGSGISEWINVFIYLDSDDLIIATTETPYAEVNQCAHLQVVDVNYNGAFLNWGLSKDLIVPFMEQRIPMKIGKSYTVHIYEDLSGRICASSKLDRYLNEKSDGHFENDQEVSLLIASRSPLGFKAIIDNTHIGLIHNNDMLASLNVGDRVSGYIKNIRPDDAIDLSLQPHIKQIRNDLPNRILDDLEENGGTSNLTDVSSPEDIFARYQVSKGNYKKALGQLYKDNKITLNDGTITLAKK